MNTFESFTASNLQNYESIINEVINTLKMMTALRDPYTAEHQDRMTKLACAIGKELGLYDDTIAGIYVSGILHDIGKIYVPMEILNTPCELNEIEFNLIKRHPQIGHSILKNIKFPWPIADIICQHHERVNGSGYPSGLSGNNILVESKILAVADVVEAVTSHRPYRPALGIAKALDEISCKKGILYDINIVNACVGLFYKKGFELDYTQTIFQKIH